MGNQYKTRNTSCFGVAGGGGIAEPFKYTQRGPTTGDLGRLYATQQTELGYCKEVYEDSAISVMAGDESSKLSNTCGKGVARKILVYSK